MESLLEERDKKNLNLVGLNFGIAQIWLFMKKKPILKQLNGCYTSDCPESVTAFSRMCPPDNRPGLLVVRLTLVHGLL